MTESIKQNKRYRLLSFYKRYLDRPISRILDQEMLHRAKHHFVYGALVGFLATNLIVLLRRWEVLPSGFFPDNYYTSIYVAFSFILFYEVASMIYVLPYSVANSIGKQYQVMSLVLIRHVFEMVGEFHHINSIEQDWNEFSHLLISVFGSLLIVFLIALYARLQNHKNIIPDREDFLSFVMIKRFIAFLLLGILMALTVEEFHTLFREILTGQVAQKHFGFSFYRGLFTVMIFADILLVLITMNYAESYHVVVRNTGLMISTVILRLSFTSGLLANFALTSVAVVVGILTSLIYNYFQRIETIRGDLLKRKGEEE